MKWLIDANLNPKIFQVLQRYGYSAESARFRGVEQFSNGKLLKWAIDNEFSGLITLDKDYVRDSGMLSNHDFCVIILLIPKSVPQKNILDWFELEIKEHNIPYFPGKAIFWPE